MSPAVEHMSADLIDDYLQLMKVSLMGLADAAPATVKRGRDGSVSTVPVDVPDRIAGRDWPAGGLTMVGEKRLDNVRYCIERVLAADVPGDFIETGVWRGGTSMFMRAVLKAHAVTNRVVYVADSFEGLPPPDEDRFPADTGSGAHRFDYLSIPLETVREYFSRYGLLDHQVRFVKGWFRDTMPTLADHAWAIIRLDGDMYESTITVLESLYPALSPGGYLIVDDYGGLDPCRRAVEDYRRQHEIDDEIRQIDHTGVFWQKRGTGAIDE